MGRKKIELKVILEDKVWQRGNDYFLIQPPNATEPILLSKDRFESLIKKYGSMSEAVQRYSQRARKCKDGSYKNQTLAEKIIAKRKEENEIIESEISQPSKPTYVVPIFDPECISQPITVADCTKNNTCIRPDLFLDWDRWCGKCEYRKECLCDCKNVE